MLWFWCCNCVLNHQPCLVGSKFSHTEPKNCFPQKSKVHTKSHSAFIWFYIYLIGQPFHSETFLPVRKANPWINTYVIFKFLGSGNFDSELLWVLSYVGAWFQAKNFDIFIKLKEKVLRIPMGNFMNRGKFIFSLSQFCLCYQQK